MTSDEKADLEAVLRSLRLAKAQLHILKNQFAKDSATAGEIADVEIALEIIIKKLGLLVPVS